MNIALPAASGIWTPLLGLLRWFTPDTVRPGHAIRAVPSAHAITACDRRGVATRVKPPARAQHRPLRIVRIVEADQTSSQVGRMVISGRMADVCAELDRLAAGETIQP